MSTLRVKNFYEPDPNSPLYKKIKKHNKFSLEEDRRLSKLVHMYGENNWEIIADMMRGRSIRQCRERWQHYLSPNVINVPWTEKEDQLLEKKFNELGSSWTQIARFFPNRNYIQVRNRFLKMKRNARTKTKIVFASSSSKNSYKNKNVYKSLSYGQVQNSYQNLHQVIDQNKNFDFCINLDLSVDQKQDKSQNEIQNDSIEKIFGSIDENFWEESDFLVF